MPISKIGSKALVDCSVAAVDIADNSITSAKLAGSIANAKLANSSVTINSSSVSLGSSLTLNALNWQTVKTSGFTAIAGEGYFCDTTSAAFTVTLPASATRGDTIALKDYAGTFATYNLTIARNGHNIQGVANNSLISTNRASVVLVYVDNTRGWEFVTESNVADLGSPLFISATGGTITTSGNFKIHSFTGDGSFVVSQVGNAPTVPTGGPANVDYLVVAGGGGGGANISGCNQDAAGGSGAGGYRTSFPSPGCNAGSFPISATTYPITVGGGGSGGNNGAGNLGSPSIFSTITSTGGGAGGGINYGAGGGAGQNGGSGGGAYGNAYGGTGNSPPVSPPQGNPGGIGGNFSPGPTPGGSGAGGGGGASAAGSNSGTPVGGSSGPGGAGSANSISGSPVIYAGGGGGGAAPTRPTGAGSGGPGGGGAGGSPSGTAGTVNTGGGGGGGAGGTGGAGGKGIIIIRYKFQ